MSYRFELLLKNSGPFVNIKIGPVQKRKKRIGNCFTRIFHDNLSEAPVIIFKNKNWGS